MSDRRHPSATIAVEDISVETAEVPSPDASPPGSRHPWRLVVAVGVVLVAATAAVAIWTSGEEQSSGPTTAPGPIRVATDEDRRALLDADGWQVTAIEEVRAPADTASVTGVLFTDAGTTSSAGTWLLVSAEHAASPLPLDVDFRAPPRQAFVGGLPAAVGAGPVGAETTVYDLPNARVTLIGNGLLPGTTERVARQVRIDAGIPEPVPTTVPTEMVRRAPWQIPGGLGFVEIPGEQRDRWEVEYRSTSGAAVAHLSVTALASDEVTSVAQIAEFFLTEPAVVNVRGGSATIGERDGATWLVWTEGAALVSLGVSALDRSTLVELAATLRLASDAGWSEAEWATARVVAGTSAQADSGRQPTRTVVDRGGMLGATSWWHVGARVDEGALSWVFRTGQTGVPDETWSALTLGAPVALVAAGRQIYNVDPPGADASEISDWYAVAVAVADVTLAGATLRLTTDGLAPDSIERPLHAVRGIDGQLLAAVALPWSSHYVAEILGPDGTTVLARFTDSGVA